jgi:aspartate/methionine/tyrosine aminotransferase
MFDQNSELMQPELSLCSAAIARPEVRTLSESRIRLVANAAMGREDVLPFWFGEPDGVTPSAIREAAKHSLDAGDTFYGPTLGLPALRESLAGYLSRLHRSVDVARIAITNSGVNGLMLACQAILSPGDRVVAVVPLWPNLVEIPAILGAVVDRVALSLNPQSQRWHLDLDALLARLTPGTRAVLINSPNNPTGWVMSAQDQARLLAHCRHLGIWILSDEAYERLIFSPVDSTSAPSMLDIAHPEDALIVANTFSKTWQMTGWRLGWLVTPTALIGDLGKLIEFNTSCAPTFVQKAGVIAVETGEPDLAAFRQRLITGRETLLTALQAIPGITPGIPDGAMYAFFKVEGTLDSVALAQSLVQTVGLGLAPGSAFGPEGEGWLRWCFARPRALLLEGIERLKKGIAFQSRP